jgi:hypothetical protein
MPVVRLGEPRFVLMTSEQCAAAVDALAALIRGHRLPDPVEASTAPRGEVTGDR